jgi:hypothetical protein
MAKIRTVGSRDLRCVTRARCRRCAPEPRKQGISVMSERENLFARASACAMLRAESLAAEYFFRGIF